MIGLFPIPLVGMGPSFSKFQLVLIIADYRLAPGLFLLVPELLGPDLDDLMLIEQLALVRHIMVATHLGAIVETRAGGGGAHHELLVLLVQESLIVLEGVIGRGSHGGTSP